MYQMLRYHWSIVLTSRRRVPMSLSQTATVDTASPELCIKSITVQARKLHPSPPIRRARAARARSSKTAHIPPWNPKRLRGMPWTRQGIPVRINNADATLNVSDVPLIKTVTLTKTSANTSITAGNSNYSLAGAVYDVYEG